MDLLATVRKEGSRGGRGEFKWSEVQTSTRREHYLGHSLMAPVGRWQKGRDLNWYAKGGTDTETEEEAAARAARERKEEIQRIKEAEEDALARALGLPVAPRNNPNMEELGARREVGKILKESTEENETAGSQGVGYGRLAGVSGSTETEPIVERLEGHRSGQDTELQYALKEYNRRHGVGAETAAEIATEIMSIEESTEMKVIDEATTGHPQLAATRADALGRPLATNIAVTVGERDREAGPPVVAAIKLTMAGATVEADTKDANFHWVLIP
ncbi:hypothetical protein A1O3_04538 [Capronia epimyces CBS 606.96]|uniref:Multiple myeloma tumor-associated protein 2-like N-terminal domain-containing protein n=1 Tax=Capronia epimyces CBS 606.96 TaxID=1182542 RepID=W9Y4Y2_9EURO|nr:uncharacterized protein A1O3_04538 [Capronia epimyces CBS 606.96]EXJ87578.1 hypothetical protein A1O3_04538 [Capronia epimyces CBS 606.96]